MNYLLRAWTLLAAVLSFIVPLSAQETMEFKEVCSSPYVYLCPHFLTDEECDHMIAVAKDSLTRATVVDPNSSGNLVDSRRTSLGMFISPMTKDPVIKRIQKRIAEASMIPEENSESIQILYYSVGAEYQPHFDYFDPSTPGGLVHFNRGGQRVATFMVYLNTPEAGGETIFPRANLKVVPVKGMAIMFYNVNGSGMPDPMSLHGGAPVVKGEKWLLTRWLRERTFH